jgi:hypothetical protein
MNQIELALEGRRLADQLEKLAEMCHPKSDQHTGLLWETDILRAKAQDAESHCAVMPNLKTSVLLQYCGALFLARIPVLVQQVTAFHASYDRQSRV